MHLLISTSGPCSNGFADPTKGGLEYAVLEVTSELLEVVAERAKLAEYCRKRDSSFYESYFWDQSVQFFNDDLYDAFEEAVSAEQFAEFERDGVSELPESLAANLDAFSAQRVEICQMSIRVYGCSDSKRHVDVKWTASPKHVGIYVDTYSLTLDRLKALVAAKVATTQ